MARKVKNFFKKIGNTYLKGITDLYGPMIRYNIYPFI